MNSTLHELKVSCGLSFHLMDPRISALLLFNRSVVSDCDPMDCSTPGFPVLHCLQDGIIQVFLTCLWEVNATCVCHCLDSSLTLEFLNVVRDRLYYNLKKKNDIFICQNIKDNRKNC